MRFVVENVHFAYNDRNVLDGIFLELFPGGITALLGSNGTGKSTLIKIMAGVLRPDAGRVEADGVAVWKLSPAQRAGLIGVISQNVANPGGFTVEEVVAMGGYHRQGYGKLSAVERKLLDEALAVTGTEYLRQRRCDQLSGGELQLVMAAQTVMQVPEGGILLADEPVSMLDPARKKSFAMLLKKIARKHSGTLVATHDPLFAAKYADRILMMKNGRIISSGTPEEMLTVEKLTDVYGTAPEITDFPVY